MGRTKTKSLTFPDRGPFTSPPLLGVVAFGRITTLPPPLPTSSIPFLNPRLSEKSHTTYLSKWIWISQVYEIKVWGRRMEFLSNPLSRQDNTRVVKRLDKGGVESNIVYSRLLRLDSPLTTGTFPPRLRSSLRLFCQRGYCVYLSLQTVL